MQVIKDQEEKPFEDLKNIGKYKTQKAIDEISNTKKKKIKNKNEANKLLLELRKIDETPDNAELVCTKTDGTKYDFNCFSLPLKIIENIYNYKITPNEAIEKQAELKRLNKEIK